VSARCSPQSTSSFSLRLRRARESEEGNGTDDRYGNGLQAASKKGVPGLYNTQNKALGNSTGLRQYYRYGIYSESP